MPSCLKYALPFFLGITGLQWKQHLGSKVDVTINELNTSVCQQIKNNCVNNKFTTSEYKPIRSDSLTLNHDEESNKPQEIELANCDANVILHQTQFHFVYVVVLKH